MTPRGSLVPLLVAAACAAAPAARAAGRMVEARPALPLAEGEGLVMLFEDGRRLPLRPGRAGELRARLEGSLLETPFQVLRTPGDTPAVGAGGQGIRPRAAGAFADPLLLHLPGFRGETPPPGTPFRTGAHEDWIQPSSPRSPRARPIRVHLPRAYGADPARRFPVIYVLDGQNAFDASTSFAGMEWALDEAADRLEREGLPPAILVGVDNGWARRLHEYTYTPDPEHGGGGAAEHLAYLLEEVEPAVAARYRIDPARRGLVGSSLGGLFALFAALRHPGEFRAVAALSPSLWWAGEAVLALDPRPGPRPALWMDMGTREGERSPEQHAAMTARLEALGWRRGRDLASHLVPGAVHAEVSWADRSLPVVRHLLAALAGPAGLRPRR